MHRDCPKVLRTDSTGSLSGTGHRESSKSCHDAHRHTGGAGASSRDSLELEDRRLLTATVICLGQDGQDLVGPDASQGPDGIQDLHLQLSNLSGAVASIAIQAPGGFEWATEPDPTGAALAEYFASSTAGPGGPLHQPGGQERPAPAGRHAAARGLDGQLDPTDQRRAADRDDRLSGPEHARRRDRAGLEPGLRHRSHARDARPGECHRHVPGHRRRPGRHRPVLRAGVRAPGRDRAERRHVRQQRRSARSPGVSATWRDSHWDSTNATLGHNHIYATLRSNSSNVVDLYFPPARDEAPPSGSSAPTMLLQVGLPGSSQVYATRVRGCGLEPGPIDRRRSNAQAAPTPADDRGPAPRRPHVRRAPSTTRSTCPPTRRS